MALYSQNEFPPLLNNRQEFASRNEIPLPMPGEIMFVPSMTTLTFHLSRPLGRAYGSGNEIAVEEVSRVANVALWQALAQGAESYRSRSREV